MIVLDSSLLVAYHDEREVHHAAAVAVLEEILADTWGRALLLEYVFLEVITVALARRGMATALGVGSILLHAREVESCPAPISLFAPRGAETSASPTPPS